MIFFITPNDESFRFADEDSATCWPETRRVGCFQRWLSLLEQDFRIVERLLQLAVHPFEWVENSLQISAQALGGRLNFGDDFFEMLHAHDGSERKVFDGAAAVEADGNDFVTFWIQLRQIASFAPVDGRLTVVLLESVKLLDDRVEERSEDDVGIGVAGENADGSVKRLEARLDAIQQRSLELRLQAFQLIQNFLGQKFLQHRFAINVSSQLIEASRQSHVHFAR